MRVAHLSDIHYCEEFLAEVDRCVAFAIERLRADPPGLIVLSGDLFDRRLEQNSRALLAAICRVSELGDIAPVLILQGTYSHDAPGALDVFRHVMSSWPIHVADRIQQVALNRHGFRASEGYAFPNVDVPLGSGAPDQVLVSCLPSVNKGAVAAAAGAENAATATGEHVAALLRAWAAAHSAARRLGYPTIVVSHGTVSESVSEHGVPMAGLDHEFTTGALFAAGADAVMLGHIHKHQSWTRGDFKGSDCGAQVIAYPGSIGRLHFGEVDPKGFLLWNIGPGAAGFDFIETPAKRLVELTFRGPPDLGELRKVAADAAGAHVRVRWIVDEEHRASVDRDAIASLFSQAAVVQLEGAIAPVQRQRAAGIGRAQSVGEKLSRWCEITSSAAPPLLERLALMESHDSDQIVEALTCSPAA
jgi:exonuclease SbcD